MAAFVLTMATANGQPVKQTPFSGASGAIGGL